MSESTPPDRHQDEAQPGPIIVAAPNPYAAQSSAPERPPYQPRIVTPILLYVATCFTTFWAGYVMSDGSAMQGLQYSVCVMLILTAHELGHFFQAVRYRVPASLPYWVSDPTATLATPKSLVPKSIDDRAALPECSR